LGSPTPVPENNPRRLVGLGVHGQISFLSPNPQYESAKKLKTLAWSSFLYPLPDGCKGCNTTSLFNLHKIVLKMISVIPVNSSSN